MLLISIHRPLAGPDGMPQTEISYLLSFQSTGPSRGPTTPSTKARCVKEYFNPQAPRGARPKRSEKNEDV